MKTPFRILVVLAVAAAAAAALVLKQNKATATSAQVDVTTPDHNTPGQGVSAKLPRLVDLGAGKCIPCKMMKPILDDLRTNYSGQFKTEFIDVWENPEEGKKHGVEVIPTQIFYDAEGKELFRHVGFFGKEDILGKWKELGVDLSGKQSKSPPLNPSPTR